MFKTTLYSATALLLALAPTAFAQDVPDEDVIIVEGKSLYSDQVNALKTCLLYTSPSPRDLSTSRMPSSA